MPLMAVWFLDPETKRLSKGIPVIRHKNCSYYPPGHIDKIPPGRMPSWVCTVPRSPHCVTLAEYACSQAIATQSVFGMCDVGICRPCYEVLIASGVEEVG